jgi:hypothetical protein
MATIKLQPSGAVVIKDGKVACACCALPTPCCYYPSAILAQGIYSVNDLPDAVTVDGVSFARSGSSYGNTTNGVRLEGTTWAKYANGVRSTNPCLLKNGVVSQFADAYYLQSPATDQCPEGFYSATILKTENVVEGFCGYASGESDCSIANPPGFQESNAEIFYMAYDDYGVELQGKWLCNLGAGQETFTPKTGFQNTPVGTYNVPGHGIVTVS